MEFRLLIVIPQPFNGVIINIVAYNFDDTTCTLAYIYWRLSLIKLFY